MSYKPNFIKRDRSNDKKIPSAKQPYRGISLTNINGENTNGTTNNHKRKNEPFVLMFRDFLFFDVKSYECRNGDLYIRNIVDGIILKRYFRMEGDDQLTVFKNRAEFDEFIDKVKEEGYMFGPETIKKVPVFDTDTGYVPYDSNTRSSHQEHIKKLSDDASKQIVLGSYVPTIDPNTGEFVGFKSTWDGESFTREDSPLFFDKVVKVFEEAHSNEALGRKDGKINDDISKNLVNHSSRFILDNLFGLRNSETGKIDAITFDLDGTTFDREQLPELFDKIVYVLETHKDKAQILTKEDFM